MNHFSNINKNSNDLDLIPVAVYCRFSDSKQEGGYSIQAQLDACRKYSVSNGYQIIQEYIDQAISGRSDDRPEFQRMMSDSDDKAFKFLIIHKYDRFSRNKHDHIVYKKQLEKNGVKVISVTEPVDHDSAYSVLMESIYEGMSEAYSRNLSRETMKGMIEGAKAGFWQSGKPPYGYAIEKVPYNGKEKARLIVEPSEAAVVRYVFESYATTNQGMKKLSQDLNTKGYRNRSGGQFSSTSVEKMLKNTVYMGVIEFNRDEKHGHPSVFNENAHEAIVSSELFYKAQKIKSHRKTEKLRPTFNYKLTSYLKCGACGSTMSGESCYNRHKNVFHYYRCHDSRTKGNCKRKRVRRELIEEKVFSSIKDTVTSKSTISEVAKSLLTTAKDKASKNVAEIKRIDAEIPVLKRKYDKLMRIIEEQDEIDYADFAPRLKEIKSDLELLKVRRAKIYRDNTHFVNANANKREFKKRLTSELIDMFQGPGMMDHLKLDNLIKEIVLTGDEVRVYWQIPIEGSSNANSGSPWLVLYEHFNKSHVLQFSFKLKAA